MTIRPLAATDFDTWSPLWAAYLAFYETERSEAHHRAYFARLLSGDPHDYSCLLAGETPLGLAHYVFHAHGWQSEPVCYLQDLYVHPAARGRGLGRALIEAVYAAAKSRGAKGVYWMTQHFNTDARVLYDSVGTLTPFIKYQQP